MADLPETSTWEPGVYQIETTDPVEGGPAGVANTQAKQLANRTAWLKTLLAGGAFTAGDLLYAAGATLFAKLGIGATGRILTSSGSAPQWSDPNTLGTKAAFTPLLVGSTTPGSHTYVSNTGRYSRWGPFVYFDLAIQLASKGTLAGNLSVTGLPVLAGGGGIAHVIAEHYNFTLTAGMEIVGGRIASGSSDITLLQQGGGNTGNLTDAAISIASILRLSGMYQVA